MTASILLTGGTGTLGREVLPRLREAGHEVRILSRSAHKGADGVDYVLGDLTTGEGVAPAVDGVEVIVHCAGTQTGDDVKTRHLVEAARSAGSPHLVFISVVGADAIPVTSRLDRMMFGYFASKNAAEQVVASSGLPWTTLRATQFHDLMLGAVSAMARLPVVPVPKRVRFQPVDAAEVATRLVELAHGAPAGLVDDMAGPEILGTDHLVRSYLEAAGKRRLLVPTPIPGKAARALRNGANLAPQHALGRRTWADFLSERVTT